MSINSVKYHAGRVTEALRAADNNDMADVLDRVVSGLDDPSRRPGALERIVSMCHVRGLGDRHVEGLTLNAWWGLLSKLDNAARKALKADKAAED